MRSESDFGKILLLNGASSSGKTTLAKGLQSALPGPFWHYSIDHLRAAGVLPWDRVESGEFSWRDLREPFFAGFHASIPAFARAGNNLVVEHIIETKEWLSRLLELLEGLDVFFVGVHCPLEELERRERARGDRRIGEARTDFESIHAFTTYDDEVDTTRPPTEVVSRVVRAWKDRRRPTAFDRLAAASQNRKRPDQ